MMDLERRVFRVRDVAGPTVYKGKRSGDAVATSVKTISHTGAKTDHVPTCTGETERACRLLKLLDHFGKSFYSPLTGENQSAVSLCGTY